MKIAMTHVDLPNDTRGGVAAQAHGLANALADRGHDVTMFSCSSVYDECRYNVHQLRRPQSRWERIWPAGYFARCLAACDFSDYDVLHTHGDNYLLGRNSTIRAQVRTFHGSARDEAASATSVKRRMYQSLTAILEARSSRVADINVAISHATLKRVTSVSYIVPCGVDTEAFRPGIKSERPSILFVGTAQGRKRGDYLATIFAQHICPHLPTAELWAVSDQPLEGSPTNVHNFGKVSSSQLVQLFQRAWVFCLPSLYEGFGVPYIEAMSAGTPAVATPNPGAREVMAEGQYGVLASDDHLGRQLLNLLKDGAERARYADLGLKRASQYAWPHVAAAYEKIYDELATGKPQGRNVIHF